MSHMYVSLSWAKSSVVIKCCVSLGALSCEAAAKIQNNPRHIYLGKTIYMKHVERGEWFHFCTQKWQELIYSSHLKDVEFMEIWEALFFTSLKKRLRDHLSPCSRCICAEKNTWELFSLAKKGKSSSNNCKQKSDKLAFQHENRHSLCESKYILEHADLMPEDNEKIRLKRYLARRPGKLLSKAGQSHRSHI